MCWCWCNDNKNNVSICNCSIIGQNNTNVDIITQPWDVLVSSPFYEVTSPLNTIEIHKVIDENTNVITFEIEKDCCPDQFVKACASDTTPWVLFNDKIVINTDWPLTYDLINCPWDAHIEIWFDVSKLNAPDKKVAVNASCSSKYLEDSVSTNDPNYFTFETVACKSVLTTNPRILLRADLYCNLETSYGLNANQTWFWWIDSWHMDYLTSIPWTITTRTLWTITSNYLVIVIPKDGRYQVNMQGSQTTSWLHTVRNQICIVKNNLLSYPILDSRTEWSRRVDLDANDLINIQAELNKDIAKAIHSDIAAANWEEMAISTFMRGQWFWGSRTIFLEEWTELTMVYKYNSMIKNTFTDSVEHTITFTSNNVDLSTNGEWAGTWWSIHELTDYALTN